MEIVNSLERKYPVPVPWQKCKKCGQAYFRFQKYAGSTCENCKSGVESDELEKSVSLVEGDLVLQAIAQAKVVSDFGKILQVVGFILIGLFSIAFLLAVGSGDTYYAIVSFVCIPLTFVLFNVLGSAIRALALYIQVKID